MATLSVDPEALARFGPVLLTKSSPPAGLAM
jgi:hypothetical protein